MPDFFAPCISVTRHACAGVICIYRIATGIAQLLIHESSIQDARGNPPPPWFYPSTDMHRQTETRSRLSFRRLGLRVCKHWFVLGMDLVCYVSKVMLLVFDVNQ